MSWVTVRQFRWTTRTGADDYPRVEEVHPLSGRKRLPVNVAEVVHVNAVAPAGSARVRFDTRLDELRLLANYLGVRPGRPVTLRQDGFRASSPHVRRFVSESFGLGMLTAAVQAAYEWNDGDPADFSALPMTLAASSAKRGVRPDLLFQAPGLLLAGEARGRSGKPPGSTRLPRERLDRLLPWAHVHRHPLVMTWAYLDGDGVVVDFFAPADGVEWLSGAIGVPDPAAALRLPRAEQVALREVDPAPAQQELFPRPRPDQLSPLSLFEVGTGALGAVEEQLFDTAPPAPVTLAGRTARGRWAPVDPVTGARGSVLLAVLDEPLPPAEAAEVARRWPRAAAGGGAAGGLGDDVEDGADDRFAAGDLSVTVHGRTVVALTPTRDGQPWDVLAD
ncbi:hypothetical protein [Saccharothrix lopnurensis]|uniref:Uncharacterized protein n=1 Tax=Saccharothrix lopnurensis TaxID=1670621 RepID=A0ABW1NYQ5_9PSEU